MARLERYYWTASLNYEYWMARYWTMKIMDDDLDTAMNGEIPECENWTMILDDDYTVTSGDDI